MNISRITVGRLYNTGSYEHIKYELTVDIHPGDSAEDAMLGMEKILTALSPKTHTHSRDELAREFKRVQDMHELLREHGAEEFKRRHGHFEGTPEEYIGRCEQAHAENRQARTSWEQRSDKARELLDDLGGAAVWTDAKLDWQDDDDF